MLDNKGWPRSLLASDGDRMKLIYTLLAICLVIGLLGLGAYTHTRLYPEKVRFVELTKIEVVESFVEVPIIVEERVFVPVEKLVIKEIFVPIKPRPFSSLEELENWLEGYRAHSHIWHGAIGLIDCEDFAYGMVLDAIEDGYFMTTEIVKYMGLKHMVCATPIGNSVYFIEATPEGERREFKEVWFGYPLDEPLPSPGICDSIWDNPEPMAVAEPSEESGKPEKPEKHEKPKKPKKEK